jgi:hypothetical protein
MPLNTDRPINRAMVVGCAVAATRKPFEITRAKKIKSSMWQHSRQNANVAETFCHAACHLSNQCRPSIHQPTVDEFRMPAEMSIALSWALLHAHMHVASCRRRVHHRDRHQYTIPCSQKIGTVEEPVGRSRVGKLTGRVSWDNGSQRSSAASRSPDRRGGVRVLD